MTQRRERKLTRATPRDSRRMAGGLATRSLTAVFLAFAVLTACSDAGSTTAAGTPSTASSTAAARIRPPTTDAGSDVVVATGLRSPWGLAFLPDQDVLVGERDSGRVMLMSPDPAASGGYGTPRLVGTVPGVYHVAEGGLLGLAVSPSFATDHLVYAYVTTKTDNRIVRFTLDGDGAQARVGTPHPILTGIAAGTFHDGGRIAFGPDGMLYAGVGDVKESSNSQNLASLNGKILRMRPDGSVPPGNPFPNSLVYSYGHRNVQGLAWDSAGRLWATEFGQNRWDEINLIRPGANYGWPLVEGFAAQSGGAAPTSPSGPPASTAAGAFTDPVVTWPVDQASPSGAAILGDTLYVAALRGERIWSIDLHPGASTSPTATSAGSATGAGSTAGVGSAGVVAAPSVGTPLALRTSAYGRLRTLAVAPDGSLWVVTNNTDSRGTPGPDDDRIIALR